MSGSSILLNWCTVASRPSCPPSICHGSALNFVLKSAATLSRASLGVTDDDVADVFAAHLLRATTRPSRRGTSAGRRGSPAATLPRSGSMTVPSWLWLKALSTFATSAPSRACRAAAAGRREATTQLHQPGPPATTRHADERPVDATPRRRAAAAAASSATRLRRVVDDGVRVAADGRQSHLRAWLGSRVIASAGHM